MRQHFIVSYSFRGRDWRVYKGSTACVCDTDTPGMNPDIIINTAVDHATKVYGANFIGAITIEDLIWIGDE